ncbi:ANTAR domain-containing protein [Lentzea atacamensis]|uniref:ANTAR domain-containing protein n=1 Tax=Lentzea atacamensis TaxID=531938 RepID=A0ABX9E6J9_9PSEU|nr:ANTAR domain-containing protein [Lentzea atacamensis]
MPGADLASVTLRTPDGHFHTPVETDPVAGTLDQLQYDLGEGPCLDAALGLGPGVAGSFDLAAESKWPRFGPAAAGYGVGAVLSTTLLPNAELPLLSGALNVYSHRPRGLEEADEDMALLLATHASLALAHTQAVGAAELRAVHLRNAIDSRDVIGQAKGILMSRRGMSADEAFDVLRRTSQDLNVKLVQLAATVIAHHDELDVSVPSGE